MNSQAIGGSAIAALGHPSPYLRPVSNMAFRLARF